MAIAVRGSAWSPFTTLVRQFDADFDNLVRIRTTTFRPAADVTKDGNDVVVTLALPGVDVDKDVDIEVTEGRLAITGRNAEKTDQERNGTLIREIRTGQFRREFSLPRGVTADRIEADYDKGLLKVRVREVIAQPTQPAKIKVRNQAAAELPETPATETPATEAQSAE
jgi:HSP20 family protein